MQENELVFLSPDDSRLLKDINDVFNWDYPECDLLPFTYINIKLQGSAFKMDVMQLSSIGIPMLTILAKGRDQAICKVVGHLLNGSINFYEIKGALETFIALYIGNTKE